MIAGESKNYQSQIDRNSLSTTKKYTITRIRAQKPCGKAVFIPGHPVRHAHRGCLA